MTREATKPGTVWRLHGGPQHGRVIPVGDVSGGRPAILNGKPRDESFLDEIAGELRWNAATEWYEDPNHVEKVDQNYGLAKDEGKPTHLTFRSAALCGAQPTFQRARWAVTTPTRWTLEDVREGKLPGGEVCAECVGIAEARAAGAEAL